MSFEENFQCGIILKDSIQSYGPRSYIDEFCDHNPLLVNSLENLYLHLHTLRPNELVLNALMRPQDSWMLPID